MGYRHHQVQDRNRKESKEVELKSTLNELRSQNQKLRKAYARLRREYDKLSASSESIEADYPTLEIPVSSECPSGCNAEIKRIPTPYKTIVVCTECKWRKTE